MIKSKEDKADAERKKAAEGGFFCGKIKVLVFLTH